MVPLELLGKILGVVAGSLGGTFVVLSQSWLLRKGCYSAFPAAAPPCDSMETKVLGRLREKK